jgi:hypothetical protein
MNYFIMTLLYGAIFYAIGFGGFQMYKVLNTKIKEAQTGWQLTAFSLLLFAMCALLLVGGLYAFIEIYRLLSGISSA